ncbi:MAG: hypothetical protein JWR09_3713 [Mucilaginibacter sp.]|nr:hypothetical protein [Mucilaginibacter sp.]
MYKILIIIWKYIISRKPPYRIMETNGFINFVPLDHWDQQQAKAKLTELYDQSIAIVDGNIHWYWKAKRSQRDFSKTIRATAILCFIASTLVPYIANYNKADASILYLGYILAGVAGGVLMLDKFFGFSSSWVRYILLAKQLQQLRNTFVENWQVIYLANLPLNPKRFSVLIDSLLTFQSACNDAIKAETEAWAKEFQDNLGELMNAIKAQSTALKAQLDQQRSQSQNSSNDDATATDIPPEVIAEAINKNYDSWHDAFGIVAVSSGKKISAGNPTDVNCIVFSPVDKIAHGDRLFQPIPSIIRFNSLNGQTYDIPTDVQAAGSQIKGAAKLLCDSQLPKRPGCSLSRSDNQTTGTFGLVVYKGTQAYVLGCYHVLCAPELNQQIFAYDQAPTPAKSIVSPGLEDSKNGATLGELAMGMLTDELDCALAFIADPLAVTEKLCGADKVPNGLLTLTDDHAKAHFPLNGVGRTTGLLQGETQSVYTTCSINYEIGGKRVEKTMNGLITTNKQADGGDSGAPVFDSDNNIVGILIATSTKFSYIVPIQRIFAQYSLTLKPSQT